VPKYGAALVGVEGVHVPGDAIVKAEVANVASGRSCERSAHVEPGLTCVVTPST
jgi:hypothetical protein